MKQLFTLILFVVFTYSYSQVGTVFPELAGTTLNDKTISLPAATKGKITLICIAYSKKAEDNLRSWMNPMYNKFVAKTGMLDANYDVNLFFIPMFGGLRGATEPIAKREMKEDTDKLYYDNVVCYRGSMKPYKENLKLEDKELPYLFILDKAGKIIYVTSGVYSGDKMDEIEEKLE